MERWDALRALSHTGAKLSEAVGDEDTGEIAARVERAVQRLRTHLKRRARDALVKARPRKRTALERGRQASPSDMQGAQLSLAVLAELRERALTLAAEHAPRARKRQPQAR